MQNDLQIIISKTPMNKKLLQMTKTQMKYDIATLQSELLMLKRF